MIDIGNFCPSEIQASFDRKRRKTRVVLDAVEPLFSNGEHHLTVLHQRSRGVRVKHVESQNQHSVAAPESHTDFCATNISKGAQRRLRRTNLGSGPPKGTSFRPAKPLSESNRANSRAEY